MVDCPFDTHKSPMKITIPSLYPMIYPYSYINYINYIIILYHQHYLRMISPFS